MNPVQQKIHCIYKTGVVDQVVSKKRQHQTFSVVATNELNCKALGDQITFAKATEKIDGTCCLIAQFEGRPWIWARHDRKLSKVGEKRLSEFRKTKLNSCEDFATELQWDPLKDFKTVPTDWMPAQSLQVKEGVILPDASGHSPGWVPVKVEERQHCWHQKAVNLTTGFALVLRPNDLNSSQSDDSLLIDAVPLSSLLGQTCELIGTNINGNPYGLGNKKHPFHILVPHGVLGVDSPDPTDFDSVFSWMNSTAVSSQLEGVVWHCQNGQLYKIHRHHFNLKWPVQDPYLSQRPVQLAKLDGNATSDIDCENDGSEDKKKWNHCLISRMVSLSNCSFDSLKSLCESLAQ